MKTLVFLILVINCISLPFDVVNDREHYLKLETVEQVTELLKASDLKTGFTTSIFVGSTFVNLKKTLELPDSARTDNEENLTEDLSIVMYPEVEINRKTLIFLFALEERRFRARTGGEVRETLNDSQALQLFETIRKNLRSKNYDTAVITLVKELNNFYELGPFWSFIYRNLIGLFFIALFALVFVWFAIKECLIKRQLKSFKSKIDKLTELSKTYENRSFVSEVCVICLENFGMLENSPSLITLECGHRFHGTCIDQWTDKASSCPTCRNKIDCIEEKAFYVNVGTFQLSMYPYVRDNYTFNWNDGFISYNLYRNSSSSGSGSYSGNSGGFSFGGAGGASGGW